MTLPLMFYAFPIASRLRLSIFHAVRQTAI